MRKAELRKNHEEYDEAIKRYRDFIKKCLNAKNVIKSQEKQDLAESVLLRVCAYWQSFTNEHIVDCVNIEHAGLKQYFGLKKMHHPNRELCEALILGDRYRSFRSWDDFLGFSKKVLPANSNPFLEVRKSHMGLIDEVYIIRNYLSHYSAYARRKLHSMYKNKYKMSKFLEPGRFLLAYKAKRLWRYFDAFDAVSNDMKKS